MLKKHIDSPIIVYLEDKSHHWAHVEGGHWAVTSVHVAPGAGPLVGGGQE